jgi:hypothetical protein
MIDVAKQRARWRRTSARRTYGLTPEEYGQLFHNQNGVCAMCKERKTLQVDHCHSTGKIRGLLCRECNLGLGHLKDSILLLNSAIQYLQNS